MASDDRGGIGLCPVCHVEVPGPKLFDHFADEHSEESQDE